MANINVTEGSGKTVATETISSVEYGLVKLVDSTAASTTRTGVAANPLQVSLANTGTNATSVVVDLGSNNDVIITPTTSGGLSIFRSLDLDETEEDVKTTAGQLYGYFITNLATSARYIKFYNATAANVSVGTTTPVITIPLEADQAANVEFSMGIPFSTAISVAATTGLADNDTGAPGANEVVVNIFYK